MLDGNTFRPINSKTELSLEARHSISLEIARKRRQRCETSIFIPKTFSKPAKKMTSSNNNKSTYNKLKKPKLRHPECYPVQNLLHSSKEQIRSSVNNLGKSHQKRELKSVGQKYYTDHDKSLTNDLTQSSSGSDESCDYEDNTGSATLVYYYPPKSKSSSEFKNEEIPRSSISKLIIKNSSERITTKNKSESAYLNRIEQLKLQEEELMKQQNLLRLAIENAQRLQNESTASSFTEKRNLPKMNQNTAASPAHTDSSNQKIERYTNSLKTDTSLNEKKRKGSKERKKHATPQKAKKEKSSFEKQQRKNVNADVIRKENSEQQTEAHQKETTSPMKIQTVNKPMQIKVEDVINSNELIYRNPEQQFQALCKFYESSENKAITETISSNVQSQAINNDESSYFYESMRPTCNYCCVQEELTIEQTNRSMPTLNETNDCNMWPQRNHGTNFMKPLIATTDPTDSQQTSDEATANNATFVQSAAVSLQNTFVNMPKSAPTTSSYKVYANYCHSPNTLPQFQQQQQMEQTNLSNSDNEKPKNSRLTSMPVKKRKSYYDSSTYQVDFEQPLTNEQQNIKTNTVQPRLSFGLPPHDSPWTIGNNQNDCYSHHNACYNVCPQFPASFYYPWWYPAIPTSCCPTPIDMIYPPMPHMISTQHQKPNSFYEPNTF